MTITPSAVDTVTKKLSRKSRSTDRAKTALPLVLGGGRAALGLSMLLAPAKTNALLAGADAKLPMMKVTTRLFAAREVFVGGGVVAATSASPAVLTSTIEAGVALDAVDAVSFAVTKGVPLTTRLLTVTAAVGYAALGIYTLLVLED
ncbi:hypothetical protein [Williamsia herbipolensis]|uniref:hypothetical protein n=1 Tax=Williamsia herbipolensis TaxID=1603258 RepID=UPI0006969412|nr:hypothetical protein [Williamsia herbipolensis]